MKARLLIRLLAAGFFPASAALADNASDLAEIRALYAKIDQEMPVKTEKIDFELKDDPMAGSITRRSFAGGLSAIKLSYSAGDHGGSDQNYYFNEKGLFFILVQDSSWRFGPGSTDEKPSTIDTLTEFRYYVRNGKVIQILKRSASAGGGAKLSVLIAKEKNQEGQPGAETAILLKRAAALGKIANSEEAVKFFTAEG